MKAEIKNYKCVSDISAKNGKRYYRIDIYFDKKTKYGKEYRKSFFLTDREAKFLGFTDYYSGKKDSGK